MTFFAHVMLKAGKMEIGYFYFSFLIFLGIEA